MKNYLSRKVTSQIYLKLSGFALMGLLSFLPRTTSAASGEMGFGVIAEYGAYSKATGEMLVIWGLKNVKIPMAAGCPYLYLTPQTMGLTAFKNAQAMLLVARVTKKPVRFYAHGERDGGCGVDYIQIND